MRHDVERVVVGDERAQVESRDVLDTVFVANAVGEGLVGPDLVAQLFDLLNESGVRFSESLFAFLAAGVDDCAVGQDESGADKHAVAVGMHATVHARGVVAHDSADHGTADRRRVGREDSAERLQDLVDLATDDARLQPDGLTVIQQLVSFPMLARHDEDRIAYALSGKGRAGRAKSIRDVVFVAGLQDS